MWRGHRAGSIASRAWALPLGLAVIAWLNTAQAQEAASSASLGEVVVNPHKRSENLQSVPLPITALGTQQPMDLHKQNLDDIVNYQPSVTIRTVGLGHAKVYTRGIERLQWSSRWNIAERRRPSGRTSGQNDPGGARHPCVVIACVEALAGPGGTLYGASPKGDSAYNHEQVAVRRIEGSLRHPRQ